jgi:hypothetical protein
MTQKALLLQFAQSSLWANDKKDSQYRIALKRLTVPSGDYIKSYVLERYIKLPTSNARYCLYQIGQVPPHYLNVLLGARTKVFDYWHDSTAIMNAQHNLIDVYDGAGVRVPSACVFIQYTREQNLLLAVRCDEGLRADLTQLYLRVYQNTYYERLGQNVGFWHLCTKATTTQALADFQHSCAQHPALTQYWVNGVLVDSITLLNAKPYDWLEARYDRSVRDIITLPVAQLAVYVSELDARPKFLLHPPNDEDTTVYCSEDVDLYLTRTDRHEGVFLYRHYPQAFRQITHRDYGLDTQLLEALKSSSLMRSASTPTLSLKLVRRHSSLTRTLPYEANRIHELYRLDDKNVLDALIGTGDSISLWRAERLETASYIKLLTDSLPTQNSEEVIDALGYHSLQHYFASTPQRCSGDAVILPPLFEKDATIYEYDGDGLLSSIVYNEKGAYYIPRASSTRYLEVIRGDFEQNAPVIFSQSNTITKPQANWRLYKVRLINNLPSNLVEDITTSPDTIDEGATLRYLGDLTGYVLALRHDASNVRMDIELNARSGVFYFALKERYFYNGAPRELDSIIPPGQITLYANRRSLIEGIDYLVDYPTIYLISKVPLIQDALQNTQSIHVRLTGLSNNLKRYVSDDRGFILGGVLSNNQKQDVRAEKVVKVIAGGRIYHPSELRYADTSDTLQLVDPLNGAPYSLEEMITPMPDFTATDTYELFERAKAVDAIITQYLTQELPDARETSSITARYALYSPFLSALIYDVATGVLPLSAYQNLSTREAITQVCSPYERWLLNDPIQSADLRFTEIHPHPNLSPIDLPYWGYRFITQVIELYAKDRVDYHTSLRIKEAVA